MRFSQIDRIRDFVEGERLTAVKSISLSEEYLQDHFPRFPVMPGVIMLESLFQASMWLVRLSDAFVHPMVAMRQAKNVRFRDLVEPGDQLLIETKITKWDASEAELSASGSVEGRPAVSGRLVLERYWPHDRLDRAATNEKFMLKEFKRKFSLLLAPGLAMSVGLRQALEDGGENKSNQHITPVESVD